MSEEVLGADVAIGKSRPAEFEWTRPRASFRCILQLRRLSSHAVYPLSVIPFAPPWGIPPYGSRVGGPAKGLSRKWTALPWLFPSNSHELAIR